MSDDKKIVTNFCALEQFFGTELDNSIEMFETDLLPNTGGISGEKDYNKLINLPSINGTTLIKGLESEDIGIIPISNIEIEQMLK